MLVHVTTGGTLMAPRPAGPYRATCSFAAVIKASMNSGVEIAAKALARGLETRQRIVLRWNIRTAAEVSAGRLLT